MTRSGNDPDVRSFRGSDARPGSAEPTSDAPDRQWWQGYVATMCMNTWAFDARATHELVQEIEGLILDGRATESALAEVLCGFGVSKFVANLIAPSIRVAIGT